MLPCVYHYRTTRWEDDKGSVLAGYLHQNDANVNGKGDRSCELQPLGYVGSLLSRLGARYEALTPSPALEENQRACESSSFTSTDS